MKITKIASPPSKKDSRKSWTKHRNPRHITSEKESVNGSATHGRRTPTSTPENEIARHCPWSSQCTSEE